MAIVYKISFIMILALATTGTANAKPSSRDLLEGAVKNASADAAVAQRKVTAEFQLEEIPALPAPRAGSHIDRRDRSSRLVIE